MPRSKKRIELQVNQAIGRKYPLDQLRVAEAQSDSLYRQLTEAKLNLANSYVSNNNLTAERNKLLVEVEDYKKALEVSKRDRDICRQALDELREDRARNTDRLIQQLDAARKDAMERARRMTAIAQAAAVVNTLSAG